MKYLASLKRSPFVVLIKLLLFVQVLFVVTNCGGGGGAGGGLSILPEEEDFVQNATFQKRQIDILWVIDNSGSMRPYQARLQNSFQSFINRFQSLNYDFRMAVTTTDAYVGGSNAQWQIGKLPPSGSGISGHRVITSTTPNLADAFLKNVDVGIQGGGHERPLQSLRKALQLNDNADFHREGSFLAIIILTDENDSSNGSRESYVEFLNEFTQSTSAGEYYSVSIIARLSGISTCSGRFARDFLLKTAEDTGGVVVNICEANYDPHLQLISDTVIELSTFFSLKRDPIIDSIVVTVDGTEVPKDDENGWSYRSKQNGIFFHGTAVPADGVSIDVDYEPASLEI